LESVPSNLTVLEFLNGTTEEDVEEADRRLALCARCSVNGGACEEEQQEGEQPFWNAKREPSDSPGLDWKTCDRWPGYLLDKRMLRWGFPKRLLRKTIEGFDTKTDSLTAARDLALAYVEDFYRHVQDAHGLSFYGGTGAGKSHLAVAITRKLLEGRKIRSAAFCQVSWLLRLLRPGDDMPDERLRVVERAMRSSLLVLDDLGAQKTSEWVRQELGMIVDHRWSNGLPILITGNDSLDELTDTLGARVVSRLVDCTYTIPIDADDYRVTRGGGG
jgi:DNA replication protein DnaC